MKTAAEHAEQRARDYVRDRGWRQEPLTWEEIEALLGEREDYVHLDDLIERIAGVALSKTARKALADAFEVDVADLTPRATA